jgi:hypothetical protein
MISVSEVRKVGTLGVGAYTGRAFSTNWIIAVLKWARTDRSLAPLDDRAADWQHIAQSLAEDVISAPPETRHLFIDGVGFGPDPSAASHRPTLPPGRYRWK